MGNENYSNYSKPRNDDLKDSEERYYINKDGFYELNPKIVEKLSKERKSHKKKIKKESKKIKPNIIFSLAKQEKNFNFHPNFSNINDETKQHFNLAENYYSNKDYENALIYYDKCINSNNDCYPALNKKACILINQEKYDDALDLFDKSLNITKRNYSAFLGKAYILSKFFVINEEFLSPNEFDMQFLEISNLYDKAKELNIEAIFFKGKFLNKIQFYSRALDCFDEFLDVTSNHDKYVEAKLHKALALKELDYFDEAIECYNELLDENIKFMEIFFSLGELYFVKANYCKVLEMMDKFLDYDENNIDALMYKAQSLIYLCKFDLALNCYNRILEIDNTFYNALLFKFELLCRLNRFSQALYFYDKMSIDNIPKCYIDLKNYALNQYENDYHTGLFSVGYNKNSSNHYEYFYIWQGEFKLIKLRNLSNLKRFMTQLGQIWAVLE